MVQEIKKLRLQTIWIQDCCVKAENNETGMKSPKLVTSVLKPIQAPRPNLEGHQQL